MMMINKSDFFKNNKTQVVALFVIFVIAFILRVLYLPQGALSFAYDQARDAFIVQEILNGDLKILGPSVSGVPGLYHGVLYYYVITPAYLLGQGDPIVVAYFLSFISSLGVFVVYYLTYLLAKKSVPGIIAALLFAFSFEASQYANLLTNASMGVWFVPLIYIGLYLWIKNSSKWGYILTGSALGLSVQSEIALAYHLVPIILWLIYSKNIIRNKEIFGFIITLIVAVFPMILSEIKFGFKGVEGLVYLLSSKDGIVQAKQLSDFFITFLNQSGKTFAYTIFPNNLVFGGLLGFLMITFSLLNKSFWGKFLATYIFAYLVALPFGGWNMKHLLVGVAPAISVLVGIFLWKYIWNNKIFFVLITLVIICANMNKIISENKFGQTIFPLQRDLILSGEIAAVDYTYEKAKGENFSISTLTSPLNTNTLWSYIYNWHGKEKYGYLPYWVGADQVGQLGDNFEFSTSEISKHFFIIEPTYGIPDLWIGYAKGDQDAISDFIEQKDFGEIVVQERERMDKENL